VLAYDLGFCQPIVRVVEFPVGGRRSLQSLGGVTRHENIHKRARFCDLPPVFSEFGSLDLIRHLTFVIRHSSRSYD